MTDLDDLSSLPPSLRTAGDSWAITELVGATALGVAAGRAVETAGDNPLIRDNFAGILVSSAGQAWARLADPELAWLDDDQHGKRAHRLGIDYQAVLTHFFDDYFRSAVGDGAWLDSSADLSAYTVDFRRLYRGATPLVLLPRRVADVARAQRPRRASAGARAASRPGTAGESPRCTRTDRPTSRARRRRRRRCGSSRRRSG